MTRILSDNNSRILTGPQSDPLEGARGVITQNNCHCISWEKAMTIKRRLSEMLFSLCFRPTLLTRPLKNVFFVISAPLREKAMTARDAT